MVLETLSPQSPFKRRVSFNNLKPDYIDQDILPNSTPVLVGGGQNDVRFRSPNYNSGLFGQFLKMGNEELSLGRSSRLKSAGEFLGNKRPKLPDAPSKSILKNKLTPEQVEKNEEAGKEEGTIYHEDASAAVEFDDDVGSPLPRPETRTRRSYSEMTNEELMALDPQFENTRSKVSNLNDFNFNCQGTFHFSENSSRMQSPTVTYSNKIPYPSSNEDNYKAVSVTIKHEEYDETWDKRTLLTIISGKRHTWNSIDWILLTNNKSEPSFLVDGDHIVVASLLSAKALRSVEKKQHYERELFRKCERLIDYIAQGLLDKNLKVKITVELINGNAAPNMPNAAKQKSGYKYILPHVFKQFQPNIVILGNKSTNLNFRYSTRLGRSVDARSDVLDLKNWPSNGIDKKRHSFSANGLFEQKNNDDHTIKLSSYIIKYATVPVILVGNVTVFHQKTPNSRKGSAYSISSMNSINSDGKSSSEGTDSAEERKYHVASKLDLKLKELSHSDSKLRFANMIGTISDKASDEAGAYLDTLKSRELSHSNLKFDESVVFNNKVHSMYLSQVNSNQNGGSSREMYKVKSLVSFDDDDDDNNEKKRKEKSRTRRNDGRDQSRSSKTRRPSNVSSKSSKHSDSSSQDQKPKKKSFWSKIGLKK